MPAEAVVVKPCPEEADAERTGGKGRGEDAAAHGGAGGVVVVEGAEADAGVAHAWGGFGEGEEEELVEQGERKERNRCGDGGDLRGDAGRAGRGAGELADGDGKDGDEGEEGGSNDAAVDDAGHEAQAEGRGLRSRDGLERGFGVASTWRGDGMGGEQDGRPLGRDGFDGRSGRDLVGFDLEDAELSGWGSW